MENKIKELESALKFIESMVLNNKNHPLYEFWSNQKVRLTIELEKEKEALSEQKKNKV